MRGEMEWGSRKSKGEGWWRPNMRYSTLGGRYSMDSWMPMNSKRR